MAMKTKIIYEDDDLIVCHKPAGIATQSSRAHEADVVSECKNHIASEKSTKAPYLGVVHRLDQPVEGLLVFAKTKDAAAGLTAQLTEGSLNKKYRVVVRGIPEGPEKTLVCYMRKDATSSKAVVADDKVPGQTGRGGAKNVAGGWKYAELTYRIMETFKDYELGGRSYGPAALMDVEIRTGRFHQIRAQLSHIGHPIVGDTKYGNVDNRAPKLMLCAYSLTFVHPRTKEPKTFII